MLVSAGLTPRFGPFRLYTELARRLSRDGFRTLRFDLGGVGDSGREAAPSVARSLEERTRLEIGAAVEHLTARHDAPGVVLGGLCSGAEDSFRYAELDPRVSGVFMIDPFAYLTPGHAWRHLRYRARRRLLRALGLYVPARGATPSKDGPGRSLIDYRHMPHPESSRILEALVKRQARLHFVYTGGMGESFNHRGQLRAMFREIDFDGRVEVDHFPHLDHTQLLTEDRDEIIEAIAGRLSAGRA